MVGIELERIWITVFSMFQIGALFVVLFQNGELKTVDSRGRRAITSSFFFGLDHSSVGVFSCVSAMTNLTAGNGKTFDVLLLYILRPEAFVLARNLKSLYGISYYSVCQLALELFHMCH